MERSVIDLRFGSPEVIAALALIASVISLFVSWRTARHSAKITTYRSATDLTLDIDRIFVEHPGLRKYFYEAVDTNAESAEVHSRVNAIAELMLDCFECIWDIRATYSAVDRGSWGHYVLDMLETAPAMKRMFEHRMQQDWYPALEDLKKAEKHGRLETGSVRAVRWARRMWKVTTPQGMSQPDTKQQP
jgi:hypothetical protein